MAGAVGILSIEGLMWLFMDDFNMLDYFESVLCKASDGVVLSKTSFHM